jgi:hypothetical protein
VTPWEARLAARRRDSARQVSKSIELAQAVVSLLAQRNIDSLLLKGVPLALLFYAAPELRPMADVDVLVRPEQLERALEALGAAGLRRTDGVSGTSFDTSGGHAMNLENGGGRVDLHWHVFDGCWARNDDAGLWERARAFNLGEVRALALSAPDQFLHVCVHGHRWMRVPPCRWVADAVTILRATREAFDWDLVRREARARSFESVLRDALPLLSETTDEPDLVPGAVQAAVRRARIGWTEGMAQRARTQAPELRGGLASLGLHADSFRRLRRSGALAAGPLGWREFARRTWGIERLRDVPLAAVSRGLRRLRQIRLWKAQNPGRRT